MKLKRCLLLRRKAMTNLDSILKSRDITLPTKFHLVKALVSSSSHVWMWELNYKESWAPKNCCFWTVVLEKILESPLDCKEIKPVHLKGNQPWILIGGTDAEVEAPILRQCDMSAKSLQFSSVAQSCPTLCDLMNHSTPGLPVHHQLPESTQTHVHRVGDAIQPSHPLSSPSPPALNLSQHQGLFQ